MSVFDVEKLLAPVSSEMPSGENLEYDSDFAAMEKAAAGTPEQQFGTTVIPGEEPDWKEVRGKALELLERTKDLRAATYLLRAALCMDGLEGFTDGLEVLHGLVERYWDSVHPQLDPDDNNDPTLRLNTIASLCDGATTLKWVREARLVDSKAMGKFTYRDVLVASGELPPPPGTEKVEQAVIDGAFADCDGGGLKATTVAVKRALERSRSLESMVDTNVGDSSALSLEPLSEMLAAMAKLLEKKLAERGLDEEEQPAGDAESATDTSDAESDGESVPAAVNGRKASAPMSLTGDISSREDVIRALDKVCEYYKRYEPSSPVPLFLNRAKRLASKSFLEILRDLTPDALNQALALGGISDASGSASGVDSNDV